MSLVQLTTAKRELFFRTEANEGITQPGKLVNHWLWVLPHWMQRKRKNTVTYWLNKNWTVSSCWFSSFKATFSSSENEVQCIFQMETNWRNTQTLCVYFSSSTLDTSVIFACCPQRACVFQIFFLVGAAQIAASRSANPPWNSDKLNGQNGRQRQKTREFPL